MIDASSILQAGSVFLISAVIFAESGLLLGLVLPGDTLLIAGGVFASNGRLPLVPLVIFTVVSTIAGYQLGYLLGRSAGPRIFKQDEGVLFRRDYMENTEKFFNRHGWKAVLIARFIAIVRTIIPLVAGMGKMNQRVFFTFNVIGGIIWAAGLILISYWIGQRVPNLYNYVEYLALVAVALTWGGLLYELYKKRSQRGEIWSAVKAEYKYLFRRS
jgi:membrane-associated protein